MKHTKSLLSISTTFLLVIGLLISPVQVSAHEDIGASTHAHTSPETKVDAGNALNAPGDARTTDPADSDEDGHDDSGIREGGQTVDAGTVPETQQQSTTHGDLDGDGYDDAASIEPNYLDDDSDDDSIGDDEREIEIIEYQNGDDRGVHSVSIDAATPRLLEALSMSTATPLLQSGITMTIIADTCDATKTTDCDDGDTDDAASPASFGISVAGVTVRGWNPDQKQMLREQASTLTTAETPNDFGIWLVSKILDDTSITNVDITSDGVRVQYETEARLLGIIPITLPTTARMGRMKTGDMTLSSGSVAEVEVEYPWYSFLVRKKVQSDQIVSSTREIADNYNASQKKEAKFKAGKALAETVK